MIESESLHKLIDVTEKIIAEKGCQKTTLNEIIRRSGLSKGAIYHYVNSKNELFALVLKQQLKQVDERFHESIGKQERAELGDPLRETLRSFIHTKTSVSNQIFFYLLSHQNDEEDQQILLDFQQLNYQLAVNWIKSGQNGGPIPSDLDADRVSAFFTILGYGMRVQSMISDNEELFTSEEVFKIMKQTLSKEQLF